MNHFRAVVVFFFVLVSHRWDKQVISVREARALPKNHSKEWRNKFMCVEGKHFSRHNMMLP